jgi:hypothetical protein
MVRSCLVGVALALTTLRVCGSLSGSTESLFRDAEELLVRLGSGPSEWDAAEVLLHEVLRADPRHVGATIDMGLIHGRRQHTDEAIRSYRRALSINPAHPSALNNLAVLLSAQPEPPSGEGSALELTLAAARLRPTNAKIVYNAAYRLVNAARPEDAAELYDAAIAALRGSAIASDLDDVALLSMLRAVLAPPTYSHVDEPRRWWDAAHAAADALLRAPPRALRTMEPVSLGTPPFGLTYTGLPHAALMRKFAALAWRAFPSLGAVSIERSGGGGAAALPPLGGRPRRKLVLGVVLERHRNTSPARLLLGPLSAIDRNVFELVLFPLALGPGNRAPRDRHTAALCALADRVASLPPANVDAARLVVNAHRVDALVYAAVGMSQLPYLLSFARLAPVQLVFGHGHPVPPGTPSVDYFLSSDLMEPPSRGQGSSSSALPAWEATQTTAQLVRFDTLTAALPSPMEEMDATPAGAVSRAQLGLPPRPAPVYACLQHSLKFHPRFDASLGAVLSADPSAVLLLLNSTGKVHRERWATNPRIAPHLARIVYLPVLPHAQFLALLRDVVSVSLECVASCAAMRRGVSRQARPPPSSRASI